VTGAAGILRISWDEAWGIKARAVSRGLQSRDRAVQLVRIAEDLLDEITLVQDPEILLYG